MKRTPHNAMPQLVSKQAPPTESWWISASGKLPPDKRAQAQARMSQTINTVYREPEKED